MKSTVNTLALDDGATTTVETWGDRGPVMLCVHGMTSSRKSWLRLARHFADRYRVVAYDQRGHGDSANVTGPMTLERGVRDLENVAAAAGGQIFVGHSWGGAVVVRGGLRTNAVAVAAIDPMIVQVDDSWYAEYIEELEETFALRGEARDARTRDDYAQWHPDDVAGKVHAVRAMTTGPIAGLRDENHDGRWDLRAEIATYPKPLLLVMAGREGSIVPESVLDEVAARHSASVRIVTLEDQGHNLYRTAFERFAAALDEFLRTC
jgi:pimeloyl-ACP methyl ester carboxylesterase